FSIQNDSHHTYLHSFPTRRSSDLTQAIRARRSCGDHALAFGKPPHRDAVAGAELHAVRLDLGTARQITIPDAEHQIPVRAQVLRSEEHTSELQSRENLVCRLLLEK